MDQVKETWICKIVGDCLCLQTLILTYALSHLIASLENSGDTGISAACLDDLLFNSCPSLLSIAVISTTTKSKLEEKRFIWLIQCNYSSLLREFRAATQGRNLEIENSNRDHWRTLYTGLQFMVCTASFSIQLRTTCLKRALPTVG